jgi:hypothetical protein
LYSSNVQHLSPTSAGPERSLLWWRHSFYRLRWKQWRLNWLKLASRIPANHDKGPAGVLRLLTEAHCDPEVTLRLAFLVASERPATKSELVGQNARQQRIKRKLSQARNYLVKAAFGLMETALPEIAKCNKKQVQHKLNQSHGYILKAAAELEQALSETSLIFIKPEDVDSVKAVANVANPQDGALWTRLQDLASMCDHEIQTLLWPRTVELAPGHELFTLVTYVKACSGEPHFPLVNDLLNLVYEANDGSPPTREAIEKQVERFSQLNSIQPKVIEDTTLERANSGELRQELLACYPDQSRA